MIKVVSTDTPTRRRNHRLERAAALGCLLFSLSFIGCEASDNSTPPAAKSDSKTVGDAADSADTNSDEREDGPSALVASAGPVVVTMADFARFHHLGRAVMPLEMLFERDEDLPGPSSLGMAAQNLLNEHVTRHLVARYELEISDQDLVDALAASEAHARFAPLLDDELLRARGLRYTGPLSAQDQRAAAELRARGLKVGALVYIADSFAAEKKLRDYFLDRITEEDLWRDYEWRHDQARVLQVHATNAPTLDEVTTYMEANSAEIEEYFKENKHRWARPDFEPTLDGGMRRQIAARLVAQDRAMPSVEKRIAKAIKKLEDLGPPGNTAASKAEHQRAAEALVEELKAERLSASITELFPRDPGGFIPQIGVARAFSKAVFERPLEEPISPRPILSNGKVWAFMLLERESPDREAFKRDLEEIHADFRERAKHVIISQVLSGFMRSNAARLNMEPLEERFPELRRKRDNAPPPGATPAP